MPGESVKYAEFVSWVETGEDSNTLDPELINDAKALTWQLEVEHALLTLASGRRVLVRGGRDGIRFTVEGEGDNRTLRLDIEGQDAQILRIEWHTHPRVTGPSDGDLEALTILGQDESHLFELGGDRDGTRISPKYRPPN